jgi:POT family proton-dependent oligopeptide transporter
MDLYLFNYKIAPDLIPFLNPAMVMLMIPLFNKYLYPFVNNHLFNLTPLRKISIGIFIAGISFGIVGFIQTLLDQGLVLGVMWQVIPYLAITAAEVLISVTGLEFAYSQAPKFMKSTITSFWLLTTFFGNLLAGIINEINLFTSASDYFYFFAIVTLVFGVIFIPFAKSYKHISQN